MKFGGCILVVAAFVAGGFIVAVTDYIHNLNIVYLDRDQALPLALNRAREACRETDHIRPVNCSDWQFVSVDEGKDGWNFHVRSHDGRRSRIVWIGRIGEVDDDSSDDPDELSQYRTEHQAGQGNAVTRAADTRGRPVLR